MVLPFLCLSRSSILKNMGKMCGGRRCCWQYLKLLTPSTSLSSTSLAGMGCGSGGVTATAMRGWRRNEMDGRRVRREPKFHFTVGMILNWSWNYCDNQEIIIYDASPRPKNRNKCVEFLTTTFLIFHSTVISWRRWRSRCWRRGTGRTISVGHYDPGQRTIPNIWNKCTIAESGRLGTHRGTESGGNIADITSSYLSTDTVLLREW